MKVLLLSPVPPPVGGIASWTINLINYLKVNDDVTVVLVNTALRSRNITNKSMFSRVLEGCLGFFVNVFLLIKSLVFDSVNVVHLNSSGSLGLFRDLVYVLIARIFRVPVVVHFRFGRIPALKAKDNWEWVLLKLMSKLSYAVIVLDDRSRSALSKFYGRKIINIPNPISDDTRILVANEKSLGFEKRLERRKVIFVGHVTKNKGVFELVEACRESGVVRELVMVGPVEGEVKGRLSSMAEQSDLSIEFLGALPKEGVIGEMCSASVLVLPSYTEGFPNVVIEAMAAKCPVIATDVGAIPSMLDSDSPDPAGIVVESRNSEALKDALEYLFSNPEKADLFVRNAYRKIENDYAFESVLEQYKSAWKFAANQK